MYKLVKTSSIFGLYNVDFEIPCTLCEFIRSAVSDDTTKKGRFIVRLADTTEAVLKINYKNGRTISNFKDFGDKPIKRAAAAKTEFGYDYLVDIALQ